VSTRFFSGLGRLTARFKFAIVVFWVVAALAVYFVAPSLADVSKSGDSALLPSDANAAQAEQILSHDFASSDPAQTAVVTISREGGLTQSDLDYAKGLVDWLRSSQAPANVSRVISHFDNSQLQSLLVSPDTAAVLVQLMFSTNAMEPATKAALTAIRDQARSAPAGLSVHVSGSVAIFSDSKNTAEDSVARTGPVTIALVIIILLIIYRSPVTPVVPLATIGISFVISRGVIAWVAQHINVSSMTETFLIAVLFGAGTDYCLFLLSRYREELAKGKTPSEAVADTMTVIGEAISSSAGTVIAGLAAMVFASFGLFNSIGPSLSIGVAVTLLAALTLTPALLAIFGRFTFWPAHPKPGLGEKSRGWGSVARAVVGRPVVMVVLGVLVFGGLGLASQGMVRNFNYLDMLPQDTDSVVGFHAIESHFSQGTILPTTIVVVGSEDMLKHIDALDSITQQLKKTAGVSDVRSLVAPLGKSQAIPLSMLKQNTALLTSPLSPLATAVQTYLSKDRQVAKFDVVLDYEPYSKVALDTAQKVKEQATAAVKGTDISRAEVYMGGASGVTSEVRLITDQDTVIVTIIVLAAVFIILALLLRSIVPPIYLVLTIVLSYFATMGIMTFVVQGLFGLEGVGWEVPFLVFIMLFALGEDYNIFLMSRVKEEVARRGNRAGITHAVERTGGIITTCGIIMIGTFGALVLSPMQDILQSGLAISIGIFLDTFIVRTFLVPSIAVLVGRWNWWPRHQPAALPIGEPETKLAEPN
jgi:putative drug exporter of the RND superfamily